jgi:hypothetical protein
LLFSSILDGADIRNHASIQLWPLSQPEFESQGRVKLASSAMLEGKDLTTSAATGNNLS